MPKLASKEICTGCGACVNICKKQAISMKRTSEGFFFPDVDYSVCIECGLCASCCPILNTVDSKAKEAETYAVVNKNDDVRGKSSSGGVFTALADDILCRGGGVFGASFDERVTVKHIMVTDDESLEKLRGSKYSQSDIGNAFSMAKGLLDDGREVLFSGTPCQIAGLYAFLKRDYDNLYTQDIVCFGVPSPVVLERYIKYKEKKHRSSIKSISFRDKRNGWKNYQVCCSFENGDVDQIDHEKDSFMQAFLKCVALRESCYDCKYKGVNHQADITLGDLWGAEDILPSFNDDKGISLVFVNTAKGKRLLERVKDIVNCIAVDRECAIGHNLLYQYSAKRQGSRESFLHDVQRLNFEKCVELYCSDNENSIKKRQLIEDYLAVKNEKGTLFACVWRIKQMI